MKETKIYCVTFYEEGTGAALWGSGYYLTAEEALTETQKKHPSATEDDIESTILFTKE